MIQGIGHEPDGLEGIRTNPGRIEVELHRYGKLGELAKKRWAVYAIGAAWVGERLIDELPQLRRR